MNGEAQTWRRLDQVRSRATWEAAQEARQKSDKLFDEYSSLARGLRAMVHLNGLGQSLAFLYSKFADDNGKPNAPKLLAGQLGKWLLVKDSNNQPYHPPFAQDGDSAPTSVEDLINKLIKRVQTEDQKYYRLATRETYAFLSHLSRWVTGLKRS